MKEIFLENLRIVAEAAGFGNPRHPVEIIGAIIGVFLSFLGIIFLCLIIYAGFLWMTSAGNDQKVLYAKKILQNAVIGMIIVLSSYAFTSFVLGALLGATK